MTAKTILVMARDLVRRGWTRINRAEDEDGRPVEPWSLRARRWSASGALEAAWAALPNPELARAQLERARLALTAVVGDIDAWNDAPERAQIQVAAAFTKAIELLESEEDPSLPEAA